MSRKRCVMRQRDAEAIVRSRGWSFEPTESGDIFIPTYIPPQPTRHDWRRGATVRGDSSIVIRYRTWGHTCARCGLQRFDGPRYFLSEHSSEETPWLPCAEVRRRAAPGVLLHRDGDSWVAVLPDFIDLQQSPAGFGATQEEAIAELERYVREKEAALSQSAGIITTVADYNCDDNDRPAEKQGPECLGRGRRGSAAPQGEDTPSTVANGAKAGDRVAARPLRPRLAPPLPAYGGATDDNNPCTDDACDPGISSLEAAETPARPETMRASIPGAAPRNHDGTECDDCNPCTDDRCAKEPPCCP